MTVNNNIMPNRLLPTYRWDEKDKLSSSEEELKRLTVELIFDYIDNGPDIDDEHYIPDDSVISPIVAMNVRKRSIAMRRSEEMIKRGVVTSPPPSLIPTFMASGYEIPGVEDQYMKSDHPSQELFAYNRVGKTSWLNRRFGEHCLKAISIAHPSGIVVPEKMQTRVKAHSPSKAAQSNRKDSDKWVIISTKAPIATVYENGRQASLISRVTGAVDLTHPELTTSEMEAITWLSDQDPLPECESRVVLARKAILLDALEHHDDSAISPFYPVLQTIYLTQLQQEL